MQLEADQHGISVDMHTLVFLEPGHFHAALTLRAANPRVSEGVHLHARSGPERESFAALVDAFNSRGAHRLADGLPRLVGSEAGRRFPLPAALAGGHEKHFAMLLDAFLDHPASGTWPEALARRIGARYTLLARARELALLSPSRPP